MHISFNPHSLVPPSATLAMNALAAQKKAAGERVYNLSAGEPMLAPHQAVIAGAQEAMKSGKTLYPPVAGIPELRKAAAEWMNEKHDSKFTYQNTIVTCGGKFGLYALFQVLLEPGDKVIIPAPYWVSYPSMVKMFGGEAVIVNAEQENGWKLKIEDLEKAPAQGGSASGGEDWKITSLDLEEIKVKNEKLKILILNNAGNPTGVLYTKQEIGNILEWAKANEVIVVSDEVYSGLVYGQTSPTVPLLIGEGTNDAFVSCASFPEYKDNVVIIQSCSKHFAMTGWRVGFVFGPEEVIKILTNIQSQSTTGTSSISQWAALGAFQNADTIIPYVNSEMKKRRDVLMGALKEHFGLEMSVPAGLYAFVSMKALGTNETDSVKFCTDVLEKANVAMVPGAPFGAEGYVRMSFGETESELKEAVEVLAEYLK